MKVRRLKWTKAKIEDWNEIWKNLKSQFCILPFKKWFKSQVDPHIKKNKKKMISHWSTCFCFRSKNSGSSQVYFRSVDLVSQILTHFTMSNSLIERRPTKTRLPVERIGIGRSFGCFSTIRSLWQMSVILVKMEEI